MSETPVSRDRGQDADPPGGPAGPGDRPWLGSPDWHLVPQSPDWPEWMDDDAHAEDEDPGDLDDYEDPDNAPPPDLDDAQLGHTAVLAAVGATVTGRRGPGMPGSAQSFPGEHASPAAGFATGKPLDTAPGCATLASFLEDIAGEDDRYRGASDDELHGVVCGWDRVEAYARIYANPAEADPHKRAILREDINQPEADAIRDAAVRLLEHGESVRSITRDWTARGIKPVAGRQWYPSTWVGMMTSPRLAGLREWQGRKYPA